MDLELVNKSYFNEEWVCKFEFGMLLLQSLKESGDVEFSNKNLKIGM